MDMNLFYVFTALYLVHVLLVLAGALPLIMSRLATVGFAIIGYAMNVALCQWLGNYYVDLGITVLMAMMVGGEVWVTAHLRKNKSKLA